jgi:hypothetical protein
LLWEGIEWINFGEKCLGKHSTWQLIQEMKAMGSNASERARDNISQSFGDTRAVIDGWGCGLVMRWHMAKPFSR